MKKSLIFLSAALILALLVAGSVHAFDYGGRTITIASYHNFGPHYTEGGGVEWREFVEELFNVKIEFRFLPAGETIDTVMTGVMAGDAAADAFMVQTWMFDPLAAAGVLHPLDDVLDEWYYDSLPVHHQETIRDYAGFAGSMYGFSSNDAFPLVYGVIWNRSIFEREGLPNLYELQANGEWTWDRFREVARAATRDTTGDGSVDQWGVAGNNPMSVVNWGFSNNARPFQNVDGEYVFTYDRPEALESLQFWHDVINVDGSTMPPGGVSVIDAFTGGNLAMLFANVDWTSWHAQNSEMTDDYGFVMIPMGPNADDYVAPTEMVQFFVLPLTVEDPEAVVEVTSALFMATDEYQDMDEFIENVLESFSYRVRDEESVATREMMLSNTVVGIHASGPNAGLGRTAFWSHVGAVLNDEQAPAAAMDAVRPEVQGLLDEVFNAR